MNVQLAQLALSMAVGKEVSMNNLLRFFAGVLLSALIVIVTIARLAVEVIGASTTPDDFSLLKQRMPAMLSWLFSTPWPVPTAFLVVASAAAAWLIWTGTKHAAAHEMEEHDALNLETITALIDDRLVALQEGQAITRGTGALPDSPAHLNRPDDRLELLLDFVALPEKQKILHALCTRIDEMVQLHNRQELKGDPREPHWLLQEIAGMPKRLALFGADEEAIKREVSEKLDEIKKDSQYFHIMPYEEGRYVSGPAKRHWHLWNAELKVYQEHANKIPKIKPPTQKEFVERLVDIERRDADCG